MLSSTPPNSAAPAAVAWLPRGLLALGMALALAGSAGIAWLQYQANVDTRLAVASVDTSQRLQLQTEAVRRSALGVRAAVLTYLLTGNLGEQERARAALVEAEAHGATLLALTRDDPDQHAHAREAASILRERAALFQHALAASPAERDAAAKALAVDPRLVAGADTLRLSLRAIDVIETRRIDGRRAAAEREWRLNDTVLVLTNLTLLVALLALVYGAGHALLRQRLAATKSDLAATRADLRQVLEGMSDGFALLDHDWRCLYFNPALRPWIGERATTAIGQRLWDAFPHLRGSIVETQLTAAQRTGQRVVYRRTWNDGRVAETRAYPTRVGLAVFITDISEQARAAAERDARGRQLAQLSQRLLDAQEAERRAIARDLHDSVGQQLAALKLTLGGLQSGAPGARHEDALHVVEELITEVRDRALELRPALLDDLGLVAALRWYCERESRRGGAPLVLHAGDDIGRLPPAVESAAYRITQEAAQNARHHAQATRVDIRLVRTHEGLRLEIADDGAGFDPEAARRARGDEAQGLASLRERAELLGGHCEIDSAPGRGTRVTAVLPLAPVASAAAADATLPRAPQAD